MSALMENADDGEETRWCSFAVSGTTSMHQPIYKCDTCQPGADKCCCIGCMNVCHRGHDVTFLADGNGYCDCGQSGCSLYVSSVPVANKLLDKRFHIANPYLIEFIKACKPHFTVHKVKNIIQETQLLRQQALQLVTRSKDTFWISQSDSPRCTFEDLAKSVGDHHMHNLFGSLPCYDDLLAITGYEWWIQVKPCPGDDDRFIAASNTRGIVGVDLHYDKDEAMASSFELGIFPLVSTVTYITESEEYCHPTVVFDCLASTPVGSPIRECFISFPQIGKHIAFDGRLLHGAPSELLPFVKCNRSNVGNNDLRITFLVNVWVGHRPSAVEPISVSLVGELNESRRHNCEVNNQILPLTFNHELERLDRFYGKVIKVKEQDTQRDDLGSWITIPFVSNDAEWGKSDDETGLDLSMWLPLSSVDQYLETSVGKGKKRRTNSNDMNEEDKVHCGENFHFQYIGDNAAARLDYEDLEGEDDFAEQFRTL